MTQKAPDWRVIWPIAALALAGALRLALLPLETIDQSKYLVPWLLHAQASGRHYLDHSFTNYAPAYDHVLALLAQFGGPPMLRIKLFSILFDVILAIMVARLVDPDRRKIAFCATLLLPSVAINSALLGQCDAIYASFVLLSLGEVVRARPVRAMTAFGTAVAVKLQAILFAPFLALLALERRLPVWTAVLIPLPYLILAAPMIIAGRPIAETMLVYGQQADTFHALAMNAPNPWSLLRQWLDYRTGVILGVPLALAAMAWLLLRLRRLKLIGDREGMLLVAAILLIAGPYLMPKMHERFFYLVSPVLVALACTDRRYLPMLLLAEAASILAYVPSFVFENAPYGPLPGVTALASPLAYAFWPVAGAVLMGLALVMLIETAHALARERAAPRQGSAERARDQLVQP